MKFVELARVSGITLLLSWVTGADAALSSSSYVQEGLIAQFDGIENVTRGGVHQADSTTWTDLVGGTLAFSVSGGAAFEGGNALLVARNWNAKAMGGDAGAAVLSAVKSGRYTAEVAYDQTEGTTTTDTYGHYSCRMVMFGHPRYWMGIGWNASNQQKDCWIGGSPKGLGREPNLNWVIGLTPGATCGQHTLSFLQGDGLCSAVFDTTEKKGDVDSAADSYSQTFGLVLNGAHVANANDGMTGRYHSVRVYDRALSDDERAVNRAVDQVRYFGADAGAVELPDGWRFLVAGGDVTLQKRQVVSVSCVGGGTVSVNGGASAESVEVWLEYPAMTCTLTAVAASGHHFVRWRGVSVEDVYRATLTDVSIGAEPPVAVIYKDGPRKLSTACYEQTGLLFHFDAIENQVRGGAHDPSATTWKDIVRGGHVYFPLGDSGKAAFADGKALSITRDLKLAAAADDAEGYQPFITAFKDGHYCAEVVYDQVEPTLTPVTTHNTYFATLLMLGHDYYWMGIDSHGSDPEIPDVRVGASMNGAARDRHLADGYKIAVETTLGRHILSVAQGEGKYFERFDLDHLLWDALHPDGASKMTYSHGLVMNGEFHGNSGITGNYHAIRLYDRPLSDDAYTVNCALDAVRFFGRDPADITLPDGYRFSLTEGVSLERRRVVSSSDATLGRIAIRGGAMVDRAECWTDLNAPQVWLTAEPVAGCKFVRWTGGVSGGDLRNPNGVFTVTGDVTAEFKKINGFILIVR